MKTAIPINSVTLSIEEYNRLLNIEKKVTEQKTFSINLYHGYDTLPTSIEYKTNDEGNQLLLQKLKDSLKRNKALERERDEIGEMYREVKEDRDKYKVKYANMKMEVNSIYGNPTQQANTVVYDKVVEMLYNTNTELCNKLKRLQSRTLIQRIFNKS